MQTPYAGLLAQPNLETPPIQLHTGVTLAAALEAAFARQEQYIVVIKNFHDPNLSKNPSQNYFERLELPSVLMCLALKTKAKKNRAPLLGLGVSV